MAGRTLPEMIIEHRKVTGLSRKRYAKAAGLSPTELYRIEKDLFFGFRPETVQKLSAFTGIPLTTLWAAVRRKEAKDANTCGL